MDILNLAPFSGFYFWGLVILFVLGHLLIRSLSSVTLIRNVYMIIVSLAIIGLTQSGQQLTGILLLFLLFLTFLVYFTGTVLVTNSSAGIKRRLNLGIIALIVLILCYFKYSGFQLYIDSLIQPIRNFLNGAFEGVGQYIFFLGVSYFSFKFIHFLIECYNKKIKNLDLLTFINYIFFFPNFFGGPINRYNSFSENINNAVLFSSNAIDGLKRIISGLFKKTVLATFFLPYSIASLDFSDPSVTPLEAVLGVYSYMFYIYFDFSGYTDMAIGSARLVGINLPENFNYPFFKRNLQQFWANWHMSLTTWLTDYIYWPLVRKMRHVKKIRKKPVTNSNICIIITFLVCGLWHGDGINFAIWGVYHGVGLAILNIYTFLIKRYTSIGVKKFINKSRVSYAASNLITFQYVAFGFLLFGCDIGKLKKFFNLFV